MACCCVVLCCVVWCCDVKMLMLLCCCYSCRRSCVDALTRVLVLVLIVRHVVFLLCFLRSVVALSFYNGLDLTPGQQTRLLVIAVVIVAAVCLPSLLIRAGASMTTA